jgi:hypothetical protein
MDRLRFRERLEEILRRDVRAGADAGGAEIDASVRTSGVEPAIATALRSAAVKPLFFVSVSLMASDVVVTSRVYPSGAVPATALAAILPPAPPRFSTTKVWPIRSPRRWLIKRALPSAKPPGAKPTTTVTLRAG